VNETITMNLAASSLFINFPVFAYILYKSRNLERLFYKLRIWLSYLTGKYVELWLLMFFDMPSIAALHLLFTFSLSNCHRLRHTGWHAHRGDTVRQLLYRWTEMSASCMHISETSLVQVAQWVQWLYSGLNFIGVAVKFHSKSKSLSSKMSIPALGPADPLF
jgi:hypothetical protein